MSLKQAIKKRCIDCVPYKSEKAEGFCNDCALNNQSLTNLKKIKVYCKWCCNGYNPKDFCTSPECSLYIYRDGHNPARKGLGGNLPKS